jgi:hypothetical protein
MLSAEKIFCLQLEKYGNLFCFCHSQCNLHFFAGDGTKRNLQQAKASELQMKITAWHHVHRLGRRRVIAK